MLVRPLRADDRPWKLDTLARGWRSTRVARLGELIDAAPLDGFVAEHDGERVGLLTYADRADGTEVVTVQALAEGNGIGRALMGAAHAHAVERHAARLWLITTNDNVRAFAFYQRWGMNLSRLVEDGVAASRLVKPTIPTLGNHGIPIRHELELELRLR